MLTLLVLQGPDKGRRYELPDAPALLGRESRQLHLSDNTVSRRHAELQPLEEPHGEWILKDLGSSNGTYVNGQRVMNTYGLKLGDQIRVGNTLLVFGAQPGITRTASGNVSLAGDDKMDSAIMHAIPSGEDSMVLAVPEPTAAAMANLKLLYQLGAALGSSFDVNQVARSRDGSGLRARQSRSRHHSAGRSKGTKANWSPKSFARATESPSTKDDDAQHPHRNR